MAEIPAWTELNEGDVFAGYRIERRLGRGGMGVLYLGVEPGLERRVALKLIAPEAAADEVFAKRFAEESRIAASIEHPNVVPIYAAGEEGEVPFIAMRYVSGSDLGRRLAHEGRLAPAEAVALIAQVGNGLDAIHRAGLVHRDVKPANVLLSGEGVDTHAYITDFGVARNVATESGLTQTGRFVGTLDYVAPEQISGVDIDARVDVYALGCLLFKLLTGEVPFPREGDAARLYAHLNDPPPAPSLYAPAVSIALDDVVLRAMSKQPGDRYPSAGDLGRAAEAALRGGPVSLPERTVATGAAATRTAATEQPEPPPERERPTEPVAPTAATRVAASGSGEAGDTSRARRVSWLAWALGGVALAGAVAAIALSGSGGDGGGGAVATDTTTSTTTTAKEPPPKREGEPKPLGSAELIGRADRVCTTSQGRYLAVRDLEREFSADPEYAEALVEIATERIRGLRRLQSRVPASLAGPYREYVKAQERVLETDRQALAAAQEGDTAGVEAARARRDSEDALREELAQEIGFEACSVPKS